MLYRRDILLGIAVLAVPVFILILTGLLLATAGGGDARLTTDSVGVIEINGVIVDPVPTMDTLGRFIDNDRIPVILIRLNTPGGGVSATQEIYETVLEARRAGKIVVASMGSVAASGGYYIAAACDTVMATPGTITGSIGVIIRTAELSELFDKIGVTFNVRKSGVYKDVGSISREMTERDKALLDSLIMDMYDQFVGAVAEGRNLDVDYVKEYADGRVFTGRQAQNLGFVDLMGTYRDAIDLSGTIAGLGDDRPVYREQNGLFWETVVNGMTMLAGRLAGADTPDVVYLWNE